LVLKKRILQKNDLLFSFNKDILYIPSRKTIFLKKNKGSTGEAHFCCPAPIIEFED